MTQPMKKADYVILTWAHAWDRQKAWMPGISMFRPALPETPLPANRFHSAPGDQVHDPRYAVPVSREGLDRGSIERELYQDPVTDVRGDKVEANRIQTGLVAMWKNGTISDEMFVTGVQFQTHFHIANLTSVATTNFTGVSGGYGGHEGHIDRKMRSENIVREFIEHLGGEKTAQGLAAWWVIGHGYSFGAMAGNKDFHLYKSAANKTWWSAMTVSALEQMVLMIHAKKSTKNNRSQMRGWTQFDPSELKIVGNYVEVFV